LGAAANPITITWIVGIGFAAIIASALLVNKRTRQWSDNRIFFTSLIASFSIVIMVLAALGMI